MKIVTSLSFQGQCREAFEFYAKVLGGKITAAMPYGDAPPGMPISGEKYKTWLMHCWLEVGDQALMGADMDVEWARNIDKPKNGFDVTLHTDDNAEAKRWFDQLSEGGKQAMPLVRPSGRPASAPSSTGSASRGWSTSFPRLTGSRRRADQEHRWYRGRWRPAAQRPAYRALPAPRRRRSAVADPPLPPALGLAARPT